MRKNEKNFLLILSTGKRCPLLLLLFHIVLEVLEEQLAFKQGKEIKRHPNKKRIFYFILRK
jgi:hypothetical protein